MCVAGTRIKAISLAGGARGADETTPPEPAISLAVGKWGPGASPLLFPDKAIGWVTMDWGSVWGRDWPASAIRVGASEGFEF